MDAQQIVTNVDEALDLLEATMARKNARIVALETVLNELLANRSKCYIPEVGDLVNWTARAEKAVKP